MPRSEHPPTPASSTEIQSKDDSHFSSLPINFELPPPAVRNSSVSSKSTASSYQPTSPTSPPIPASEVVKLRRRSSVVQGQKNAFALPPPPTRSRKIIQMKPRGQTDEGMETLNGGSKSSPGKSAPITPPKKRQPSSTSVAGRKIARKTAHSLIERRRRSKMNEEFGVLKDMIPACTGEMHKLAILQASIDYVRYLEDCVAKLKAENKRTNSSSTQEQFMLPPAARRETYSSRDYDEDDDVEMGGSQTPSPALVPIPNSRHPSVSPALLPQDANDRYSSYKDRQNSYSSVSTHRHYSFSNSTTTSPALLPGTYDYNRSSAGGSALTSPALLPQRDIDQEATAALLMLNTDRRSTHGRGLSVKDLLST